MMDKSIGVLGGGHVGRMLLEECNRLNIKGTVLDTAANAPAKQIAHHGSHVTGSYSSLTDVKKLATHCDVISVETDHPDSRVLHEVVSHGKNVFPSPRTLDIVLDKLKQKIYFERKSIATPKFAEIPGETREERHEVVKHIASLLGLPLFIKARTNVYDGRHIVVIQNTDDMPLDKVIDSALRFMGDQPLYAEQLCNFTHELSVTVIKTKNTTLAYPVVELVHRDGHCKAAFQPPRDVADETLDAAKQLAEDAVAGFEGKGVYSVEMLLSLEGQLCVNGVCPKPHHSGNYTMDACRLSQYAAHIRAILDLPLTQSHLTSHSYSITLNILGGKEPRSHMALVDMALETPGAYVHMYGVYNGKPGQAMGHLTITASTMEEAEAIAGPLIDLFDIIAEDAKSHKVRFTPSCDELTTDKDSKKERERDSLQAAEGVAKVAVIMSAQADLEKMFPGVLLLDKLKIPRRVDIISPHRTPGRMIEFARTAEKKGYEVIIAGASGAAHLPGMTAAETLLPVMGVPIKNNGSDGMAAVASILEMPRGTPVATFAPNNSINAALEAARILALKDSALRARLDDYRKEQAEGVVHDSKALQDLDIRSYLSRRSVS